MTPPDRALLDAADALSRRLARLRFAAPVTHVYNPLTYARAGYEAYVSKYGAGKKRVVLLGMNPGPFGMAQTGVPFGEVAMVRDFLGIDVPIGRPKGEHDKRRIEGFACQRSEVSGTRLWGLVKARFGSAARFFEHGFIANYCPLVFMEESGRNFTPDKLRVAEREPLYAACDEHLERVLAALEPACVVGVGAFAQGRARAVLAGRPGVSVGTILHPSPASPAANAHFGERALAQLEALGALALLEQ